MPVLLSLHFRLQSSIINTSNWFEQSSQVFLSSNALMWLLTCRSSAYLRAKWSSGTPFTMTLRRWTCSIQVTWSGTRVPRVSSADWLDSPANVAPPWKSWPVNCSTGRYRWNIDIHKCIQTYCFINLICFAIIIFCPKGVMKVKCPHDIWPPEGAEMSIFLLWNALTCLQYQIYHSYQILTSRSSFPYIVIFTHNYTLICIWSVLSACL